MPFLTQGKTNWKYIIIFLIVAVIIGAGILGWIKKQEIPFTELPEIEITKKPEDETANWKTYKNEEYGFEIKYPNDWSIIEEKKEYESGPYERYYEFVIFHPENITEVEIQGEVHVKIFSGGAIDDFFEKQVNIFKQDPFLNSIEEVTIDGMKGFKGTALYQEEDKTTFILDEIFQNKEKQSIYRIVGMGHDSDRSNYQEKTNLIISTLKFLH